MIQVALYLLDDGTKDEAFFVRSGYGHLEGTEFENAGFINFENEEIIHTKWMQKTEWINDEWTEIMLANLTLEEFLLSKPYLH